MSQQEFTRDVLNAIDILAEGGVILYPTDTVWGLGCDATNPFAVEKIFALKKRSDNKSLIILLDTEEKLAEYVQIIPSKAFELINQAKKPLTIVYPSAMNLAENLVANNGTIAIRITSDPFCKRLLQLFNKPIVSTSANISGQPTPVSFQYIDETLRLNVDYVVNWRQNEPSTSTTPSGIIALDMNNNIIVIRE